MIPFIQKFILTVTRASLSENNVYSNQRETHLGKILALLESGRQFHIQNDNARIMEKFGRFNNMEVFFYNDLGSGIWKGMLQSPKFKVCCRLWRLWREDGLKNFTGRVPSQSQHVLLPFQICTEKWPTKQSGDLYFVFANCVMCYLLPLTIISVCYILIWHKVSFILF